MCQLRGVDPESRTLSPSGAADREPEWGLPLTFCLPRRYLLCSKFALCAEKWKERPFGFFCDLVRFRITARPLS